MTDRYVITKIILAKNFKEALQKESKAELVSIYLDGEQQVEEEKKEVGYRN